MENIKTTKHLSFVVSIFFRMLGLGGLEMQGSSMRMQQGHFVDVVLRLPTLRSASFLAFMLALVTLHIAVQPF